MKILALLLHLHNHEFSGAILIFLLRKKSTYLLIFEHRVLNFTMDSVLHLDSLPLPGLAFSSKHHRPCVFRFSPPPCKNYSSFHRFRRILNIPGSSVTAYSSLATNSAPVYVSSTIYFLLQLFSIPSIY